MQSRVLSCSESAMLNTGSSRMACSCVYTPIYAQQLAALSPLSLHTHQNHAPHNQRQRNKPTKRPPRAHHQHGFPIPREKNGHVTNVVRREATDAAEVVEG